MEEMKERIDCNRRSAEDEPQDFSLQRKIQEQSEIGEKKEQKRQENF